MKILIVRPWPSVLDVTRNTYNIQEVGLAKALVKRGHPTDILFWTDGDEMTVKVEVEGAKPIHVFYRHGKVLLKNVWFKGQEKLFARYDVLQTAEYNQMFSWHLAGKYPEKTVVYHGPYYSPFNKNYNRMCRVFDALFVGRYRRRGTRFLTKSELARKFLLEKRLSPEQVTTVASASTGSSCVTARTPGRRSSSRRCGRRKRAGSCSISAASSPGGTPSSCWMCWPKCGKATRTPAFTSSAAATRSMWTA